MRWEASTAARLLHCEITKTGTKNTQFVPISIILLHRKTLFMTHNTFFIHRVCCMLALILAPVILTGCGDPGLPVVKVAGKVLLDGEPVEGAMVSFSPVDADGRYASGMTDASGEFMVMTQGATRSGALPGNYNVVVSKHIAVDARGNLVTFDDAPSSGGPPVQQVMPIFKSVLPGKYGNANTSELSAEVTRRGQNRFVFELTK